MMGSSKAQLSPELVLQGFAFVRYSTQTMSGGENSLALFLHSVVKGCHSFKVRQPQTLFCFYVVANVSGSSQRYLRSTRIR